MEDYDVHGGSKMFASLNYKIKTCNHSYSLLHMYTYSGLFGLYIVYVWYSILIRLIGSFMLTFMSKYGHFW